MAHTRNSDETGTLTRPGKPAGLRGALALTVSIGLLLAGGCASRGASESEQDTSGPTSSAASAPTSSAPSAAEVGANELGEVPILMYHRITPNPQSVYDRTPQRFRAELQRLVREDYVPVTTAEYATGNMDVPAGKHPVVLTFDDAAESQFRLNSSGEPAEGTAVAILREVAAAHEDFRAVASLYITAPPFGGEHSGRKLRWLHEHGFELGNHTLDHPTLSARSASEATHQIAEMQRRITRAVPDAAVSTIALPRGVHPQPEKLARSGESDGVSYQHDAVLLVGARPAPSPFSANFDPLNVPRIRSQGGSGSGSELGSTAWLDKLAADPDRRYTSDGDPSVISHPADSTRTPAPDRRTGKRVNAY
ncbi:MULTISPECIES: polysaccharide deacetylase family protein [unclassified Actinopolyspora]|uniref:polysaccharide deacetylase family protein n=1 Tax=unclassified Actinopolyspora TaxID=2639451 RepID=UPI001F616DDC|nr:MULTISPECIES: polysaccharide deacetylase family protein [unclassified Actinopolyspora]